MFIRFDMIHERDGRTDRQTMHFKYAVNLGKLITNAYKYIKQR